MCMKCYRFIDFLDEPGEADFKGPSAILPNTLHCNTDALTHDE